MRWLPIVVLLLAGCTAESASVPGDARQIRPLQVGMAAPAFTVRRPDGSELRFEPRGRAAPVLLIFYRGGWCPYCNAHLGKLREAEEAIERHGVEVLFLSADRPEILYSSLKEPADGYTLLSDARMEAARAFGIAFRVDAATIARYLQLGIDLAAASGESHGELPVPAVFLIDRDGIIRFAYANADYKVRVEPGPLIEAVERSAR